MRYMAGPSFGGARGFIQKPQLSRGSLLRAGPSEGGARWGPPTKKYDLAEYSGHHISHLSHRIFCKNNALEIKIETKI